MFLNSNFPLPKQGKSFEKPLNAGHDAPPEVFRCVASEMANELSSTQIKLEETEHQNKKLHEEISSLKSQLNEKSLKIRRLDTLSSECLMLKSENKKLSKASVQTNHILVEKKINLKRAIAREQYYREKVSRLEIKLPFTRNEQIVPDESFEVRNDTTIDHEEQIINLLDENENLKQEIRILQNEINELQADLSDKIITCDENGKFSSDMQQCVYSFLQHHVSSTHVSSVISAVLKLAGKTASRLPSVSTVNNMNVQRLVLAQKQLGESIKKTDDTCLYTDETSKFENKYGGYHLSDQNGNMYVLGLRLLPTKSSSDTLSVFHEILDDIDLACNTTTNEKSLSVFTSIKATMSDRAATEIKFNSLLESYRKSILPLTLDNYSYFSESEKLSVDRLYNFFCGLHPLIHFAETANASMKEAEQGFFTEKVPIFDPSFQKGDESVVARLMRTTCKAIARGADEKSGCHGPFKTFILSQLKLDSLHSVPLQPFRGNRFNILFSNAAGLFYLHRHLLNFLKCFEPKKLLRSVYHDLQEPFLLAGCKALGLLSYTVMAPLWRFVEAKETHITDMNHRYIQLVTFFNDAALNTEDFISGTLLPFGEDTYISKDAVYNCLAEPWSNDTHVITILKILLPSFAKLSSKIYSDHLPDGKFYALSDEARTKTKCVQKHNKFAEMAFAYMDQLLRFKPNIKSLASESYLMFCCNKTQQWLENKSTPEKDSLLCDARKQVKLTREKFKVRQKEIHQRRLQILQEKAKKVEELEQKKLKQKEDMTNDIVYFGLWQSENVDLRLASIPTKTEKEKALKTQLRFREKVLQQKMEKSVFAFSHKENDKRIFLNIDELANNVKILIRHAFTLPSTSASTSYDASVPVLIGKQVLHKFANNTWYKGNIISQVVHIIFWVLLSVLVPV